MHTHMRKHTPTVNFSSVSVSAYLVEIISHVDNVIRNQARRDF